MLDVDCADTAGFWWSVRLSFVGWIFDGGWGLSALIVADGWKSASGVGLLKPPSVGCRFRWHGRVGRCGRLIGVPFRPCFDLAAARGMSTRTLASFVEIRTLSSLCGGVLMVALLRCAPSRLVGRVGVACEVGPSSVLEFVSCVCVCGVGVGLWASVSLSAGVVGFTSVWFGWRCTSVMPVVIVWTCGAVSVHGLGFIAFVAAVVGLVLLLLDGRTSSGFCWTFGGTQPLGLMGARRLDSCWSSMRSCWAFFVSATTEATAALN